jgi:hypothetical protein
VEEKAFPKQIGEGLDKKKKKSGNAIGMKSGRSPICHMINTKVYTSVDMTSQPASSGRNHGPSSDMIGAMH